MVIAEVGSISFGVVIGWITYRTLRRKADRAAMSDIASVIGAVGGAGVTALFKAPELFGGYSIGLAIGFFLYLIVSIAIKGKRETSSWLGD
jgi:NhaP-type Na+/H+ or K+/H+ antiporter